MTPWGAAARDLLADGDWHTLDEIVAHVGHLIAPGVAHRATERKRRLNAGRRGSATVERTPTPETVATGRRLVVSDGLGGRVRAGYVERSEGPPRAYRVRRRDGAGPQTEGAA